MPGAAADRRYVDWFLWARSQGLDDQSCHAAADAAAKVEGKGTDPIQAAIAGARKARQNDFTPSLHRRELCNWYVWALDRHQDPDRALEIANAAALSVERGMTRTQAFDVAMAYAHGQRVRLGPPLSTRLLMDPGCFVLGGALVTLGLALFSGLGGFVLLIALVSFAVPLRSARFVGRFTRMMAIALLIDIGVVVIVALGIRF